MRSIRTLDRPGPASPGEDHALLAKRHTLYKAAKAKNPAHWSGGTRNWTPIGAVDLNPQRQDEKAVKKWGTRIYLDRRRPWYYHKYKSNSNRW